MSETNNKTDWSKLELGALWKRKSPTQTYLSGYIKVDEFGTQKEVKVVVFSNKSKKDNEKAPDFRVYLSEPKKTGENKSIEATKSAPVATAKKVAVVAAASEDEDIL
jgi:uncharacterized protein (DUF736 family)